jgi:hypothetical protein
VVHGGDAVLRQRHDGCSARLGAVQQRTDHMVQLGRRGRPGCRRTVALQVVVEVRKIDQGEVGVVAGHEVLRSAGDPA